MFNENKEVNVNKFDIEVKQMDIFYCDLGEGYDNEQSGKRPCLVIQNDVGNKCAPTTIIAPITTQIKYKKNGTLQPTQFLIENYREAGLKYPSVVLFEQVRAISKKRILDEYPVGKLNLEQVAKQMLKSFGFDLNLLLNFFNSNTSIVE